MTLDETLELLTQIALVDDRVVKTDEAEQTAQLTMWAAILRDVPLAFAGQAVGEHYAESAWPVMPKDIAGRWRDQVRDRLGRATGTFEPTHHPEIDPDDGRAYVAALRSERAAVATGAEQPREVRELVGRTVEPAPATEGYLAAKAALRSTRQRPAEDEAELPELAVRCRTCGADAGRNCRTLQRGREMTGTHPDRKSDYEAAQYERQAIA